MSNVFSFDLESPEGSNLLKFSGNIDENSVFPEPEHLNAKLLIIDLDNVEMINSLGIRSWTRWMKELRANIIQLKKCRPALVQQMNIVSGFLTSVAFVESFYVPYYCDHCDSESVLLVNKGDDYQPKTTEKKPYINIKSPLPCESCGEEREIDALEEKYFSFIKR